MKKSNGARGSYFPNMRPVKVDTTDWIRWRYVDPYQPPEPEMPDWPEEIMCLVDPVPDDFLHGRWDALAGAENPECPSMEYIRKDLHEKALKEIERLTNVRDAILQQARIWAYEAKVQRSTVWECGALVGLADWQDIAGAIELKLAEAKHTYTCTVTIDDGSLGIAQMRPTWGVCNECGWQMSGAKVNRYCPGCGARIKRGQS